MKTVLLVVVLIALLAGGAALYLRATTPSESTGLRLPLSASQRTLIAAVPADAEAFALVPSAAVLHGKLLANPVTREPVREWSNRYQFPTPWMIGGADVVLWKAGKGTSYAMNLDPFRALLVRFYLRLRGGVDARQSGGTFVINSRAGEPLPAARLDEILALAATLPPADALVVQIREARGAYPPIARPAVTAVQVSPSEVFLTSRASGSDEDGSVPPPLAVSFPRGALMSATFREPPRMLSDLDRLVGSNISVLLRDGGAIALYDVNTRTLLPRPRGIVIVPADAEKRAASQRIARVAEAFGGIRDSGSEILIALDPDSLARYEGEQFDPPAWPATEWSLRADPRRLVPVLEQLGESTGLRLAAPRVYRAARDLRRWVGFLRAAEGLEASHSRLPGAEELRVRITSK